MSHSGHGDGHAHGGHASGHGHAHGHREEACVVVWDWEMHGNCEMWGRSRQSAAGRRRRRWRWWWTGCLILSFSPIFHFPAHAFLGSLFSQLKSQIRTLTTPLLVLSPSARSHVRDPPSTTSHATVRVASAHDASITYDEPTPC